MKFLRQQDGLAVPVLIGVIATLLVLSGIAYYNMRPEAEKMMNEGEDMMNEGEKMMEEGEDMMNEGEKMMEEGEQMMEDEGSMMEEGDEMMEEGDEMMEDDLSFSGQVIAGSVTPLLDFNKADYEKALASDKLLVIYFYANWCPVCKEETQNSLYPAFNELNNENVVGFRVNYNDNQTEDAERDLAREFGVAYQHTKVFVKNGERILKAPDSWSKQRYFDEISSAL